jgi:hypothetical protein
MKPETTQLLVVSLVLATAVLGGWYMVGGAQSNDPMQDRHLLERGKDLPPLWIYVNDSEVNARAWKDFGARNSYGVINIPFLNLCYQTCVQTNGRRYRIEVIGGLTDLAVRLGGWEALPSALQNPQATVREPELNWIRAAVLSKWGGLWVSPATIWLKEIGELPKDRIVLFGSDDEVTFVGDGGTVAPSLRVAWSPKPAHPVWVSWEARTRARLERRGGGSEFRRDELSDAVQAQQEAAARGEPIELRPTVELTRKGAAGRRIQVEDLLAAGTEGNLPFTIKEGASYVPVPWPELQERRAFGWFLRMSEDQILDSDLAISHVLRKVIGPGSGPGPIN